MDRCARRLCTLPPPPSGIHGLGKTLGEPYDLSPNCQILSIHSTPISLHGTDALCILLYDIDIGIRLHGYILVSGVDGNNGIEECYFVAAV
jgi:hypothetical protein